jgi:hypothetical protein
VATLATALLRGHGGAEITAWTTAIDPVPIIVAPAFPYQGRITRSDVQLARPATGAATSMTPH